VDAVSGRARDDGTMARDETKASRGWLTYLYQPLASRMAGYTVIFAVVAGFSTGLVTGPAAGALGVRCERAALEGAGKGSRQRQQAKAAGQ
jgi:hypothetical protein